MPKEVIDFVGLNRQIVKKSSTTTNSITSAEHVERQTIPFSSGLAISQEELFPALSKTERDAKHLANKKGLFTYHGYNNKLDSKGLKNYTISVDFEFTAT